MNLRHQIKHKLRTLKHLVHVYITDVSSRSMAKLDRCYLKTGMSKVIGLGFSNYGI